MFHDLSIVKSKKKEKKDTERIKKAFSKMLNYGGRYRQQMHGKCRQLSSQTP